jgi:hypothetical protein
MLCVRTGGLVTTADWGEACARIVRVSYPPWGHRVVIGGWAFSYGRGTPVLVSPALPHLGFNMKCCVCGVSLWTLERKRSRATRVEVTSDSQIRLPPMLKFENWRYPCRRPVSEPHELSLIAFSCPERRSSHSGGTLLFKAAAIERIRHEQDNQDQNLVLAFW